MEAGPNPDISEPNGQMSVESFSATLPFGSFETTGRPEEYAWGKAKMAVRERRDEGGAALLIVEVPDDIVGLAVDDWFPLSQGFVQFDRGPSMSALRTAWPTLKMRIIALTEPNQ